MQLLSEGKSPCWLKYHHRNYIRGAVYLWDGLEHGHKLQGGHGDDPPDLKCGTLMHIAAPDFHKYCSEFTKTPPQAKNLFFFWVGDRPLPGQPQSFTNQAFWIHLCIPENSSRNYACGL